MMKRRNIGRTITGDVYVTSKELGRCITRNVATDVWYPIYGKTWERLMNEFSVEVQRSVNDRLRFNNDGAK